MTTDHIDVFTRQTSPPIHRSTSSGAGGYSSMFVAVTGSFLAMLDTTVVNVSLHATAQQFGDIAGSHWILTAYMLALCTTMTGCAWLVERFGSKRVFAASLVGFLAGSLACALSPTLWFLITARALTGMAAGVLTPVSTVLLTRGVPRERIGHVQSLQGSVSMIGPLVGPTIGGLLVSAAGWPAVYWINVPACIVLLLVMRYVPSEIPEGGVHRLDLPGLATGVLAILSCIVLCGMLGTLPLLHPLMLGIGLAAVTTGALFILRELRTQKPLLNLRLYSNAIYGWSSINIALLGFHLYAPMVIIPLYLQAARGNDPIETALILSAGGIGVMAAGFTCPSILRRFHGGHTMIAGIMITLIGSVPLVLVDESTSYEVLCAALVLRGVGTSLTVFAAMTRAFEAIPGGSIADASSQLNLLQRLGGTLAAAVTLMAIRQGAAEHHGLTAQVFGTASLWMLVATVITLAPAAFLLRAERQQVRKEGTNRDR